MDLKIKIWLVEDNVTFRESIGRLLKRANPQSEIFFFANCETAVHALAAGPHPDVMLLDIRLPGMSGVEGISKFRKIAPETRIVMLTSSDNQTEIQAAIRQGASGYLLKTAAPEKVLESVHEVMQGGAPLTPQVAATILGQMRDQDSLGSAAKNYGLNPREQEALSLLVEGITMKEMGVRMGISYHTIDFYLRNLYVKLQVQSRSAAVAKALRENLAVSPPNHAVPRSASFPPGS